MVALDGRVAKAVFGLSSYMTEKMQHVTKSEYLLTRCPAGTEARLRGSGSCFWSAFAGKRCILQTDPNPPIAEQKRWVLKLVAQCARERE